MRDCDPALSQASTTCTSPQLDSDGDEQDESSSRAAFPGLDCRHTHQHNKDGPGVFGYDSSDDDGPDAEEEDDMHDLEHSSVTVGEDEMRARIADAMRGLHRLEHMNIDPRELPTIRALFVRWSITQWTLEGTHGAQRPWTPQGDGLNKAPVCQTGIGHSLPASGKVQHSVSRQKRTRDDREWDESPECAQLGTIRGSGCCIVKARCAGIPRG
jgi:hypothetical protein